MDKVIIAENLSLSYKEFETIISKASFSIDAGTFVFITGASGSGKSTLLKSLYGAIEPRGGQLVVGGVKMNKISTFKLNFLRRHVGTLIS